MGEQHQQQRPPVHNSEVYLLNQTPFPAIPPPSPPSPITPAESEFCAPIEALSLSDPSIPVHDLPPAFEDRLASAVHVLNTEAQALQCLAKHYATDRTARDGFDRAVDAITRQQGEDGSNNGKVVVVGVGKSGHIAKKLVATFNSLAIQAVFLHPTEALHGDLGQINSRRDTLLLITFSGKTPELLLLLPHLAKSLPLILITAHTHPHTCEIVRHRPDTILLPAPVHEPETTSFGVSAPTTSTTVALAVGDALAMVASQELHPSVASVFAKNHPGGAIGAALRRPREEVRHLVTPFSDIAYLDKDFPSITGADILRAGYASSSGWVRLDYPGGCGVVSPSRIRRLSSSDLAMPIRELPWLITSKEDFIRMRAETTTRDAADWIRAATSEVPAGISSACSDESEWSEDSIIAVSDKGECIGLVEVARLLEEA
ncbi:arabinose 5-phosphate isomerase [Podospora aff. communis PSN243]|uniref:Arabinose 5-phosphate isomerase n=1 Tax=Podospora aff. communis PSN243 TaxID=3040156 RepID=A0AAV9GKP7_9PEZI|nr:arabinose 5-phosphate isomerase [Podospora aff. communis PSN243]